VGSDLSPYQSKVYWKIEQFGPGFRAIAKLKIDYRWDTDCEWIETNRIFGHKGKLTQKQFDAECLQSLVDLIEKLDWVYQANHKMFDVGNTTVRFKR